MTDINKLLFYNHIVKTLLNYKSFVFYLINFIVNKFVSVIVTCKHTLSYKDMHIQIICYVTIPLSIYMCYFKEFHFLIIYRNPPFRLRIGTCESHTVISNKNELGIRYSN